MKKILLGLLPLLLFTFIMPTPASAHVLIKDDSHMLGAVLHVSPDDDPIAGHPSDLIFDVSDSSVPITKNNYQAQLLVNGAQVDASISGSFVIARYTFQSQGIFDLELLLTPQNPINPAWHFHYVQRVSRGITAQGAISQSPAWAPPLLIGSITMLLCLLLLALGRRRRIAAYSHIKK